VADVTRFAIYDDRNIIRDISDGPFQGNDPGGTPLQIKTQIRLISTDQIGRGLNDGLVKRQNRFVPAQGRER
jgi:hypothetical protein